MNNLAIVIPSLEPGQRLLQLLVEIRKTSPEVPIIIVNDGSGEEYDSIFDHVKSDYSNTLVLSHDINRGKGAALKTAMNYVLKHMPEINGIVTMDSDGQHLYKDVYKCMELFQNHPNDLILGVRRFGKDIPFRSRLGNILTSKLLGIFTGIHITDTQTGLRVIPRLFMRRLIHVSGDRFEFEMKMLFEAKESNVSIIDQPITTVYLENNTGSHFRVISDSVSIYSIFFKYAIPSFFRYTISSLLSFVVDIGVFSLTLALFQRNNFLSISVASVLSRVLSSAFNYLVNRHAVFSGNSHYSAVKYATLAIAQIFASSILVSMVHAVTFFNPTYIKVVVDCLLFFVSYHVQKKYIFKELTV